MFIQHPDSTAVAALGTAISGFVLLKLTAVYGAIGKFVTDLTSKISDKITTLENKLPSKYQPFVTAAVAYVGTTLVALVNAKLTKFGLSVDLANMNVFVVGAFSTLAAMGVHGFLTNVVKLPNLADLIAGIFKQAGTDSTSGSTPTTPPAASAVKTA